MSTTRRDFGTAIATLARLYAEAEANGDARRAKVYARAVDLLLDAWPSEPEQAHPVQYRTSHQRLRTGPSKEHTLVGLGVPSDTQIVRRTKGR